MTHESKPALLPQRHHLVRSGIHEQVRKITFNANCMIRAGAAELIWPDLADAGPCRGVTEIGAIERVEQLPAEAHLESLADGKLRCTPMSTLNFPGPSRKPRPELPNVVLGLRYECQWVEPVIDGPLVEGRLPSRTRLGRSAPPPAEFETAVDSVGVT